jgi:hypothetical protein
MLVGMRTYSLDLRERAAVDRGMPRKEGRPAASSGCRSRRSSAGSSDAVDDYGGDKDGCQRTPKIVQQTYPSYAELTLE